MCFHSKNNLRIVKILNKVNFIEGENVVRNDKKFNTEFIDESSFFKIFFFKNVHL